MSSLYRVFGSDEEAEKKGVFVTYDDTRFLIARAGGSNTRYREMLRAKLKPYKRQIDSEVMSDDVGEMLLAEVYARSVILRIDTKGADGEWLEGQVPQRDGTTKPFTVESTVALLLDLRDLFVDLQQAAQGLAMFRREQEEADAKN